MSELYNLQFIGYKVNLSITHTSPPLPLLLHLLKPATKPFNQYLQQEHTNTITNTTVSLHLDLLWPAVGRLTTHGVTIKIV